jgi:hypothetical protein
MKTFTILLNAIHYAIDVNGDDATIYRCCSQEHGDARCESMSRDDARAICRDLIARGGQWVDAKDVPCWKCGGSGEFHSGGYVLNGKFTGKVGDCYACNGKGWQTAQDLIRCDTYWSKYARVSAC